MAKNKEHGLVKRIYTIGGYAKFKRVQVSDIGIFV